jgi:hypothetical protein
MGYEPLYDSTAWDEWWVATTVIAGCFRSLAQCWLNLSCGMNICRTETVARTHLGEQTQQEELGQER